MQQRKLSSRTKLASLVLALSGSLLASSTWALSPPNLTTNIPWANADNSPTTIAAIEAAFNAARRAEETQLSLPANKLGNLKLPSNWFSLTDNQKALYLINAERTARSGMQAGVEGLPLAGVEEKISAISAAYAQLLVDNSAFSHFLPSENEAIDNPPKRINQGVYDTSGALKAIGVGAGCTEPLSRSENLAYFFKQSTGPLTAASIPLPLERAIYAWIYDDAGSAWGHREAVLLQDGSLANPNNPTTGFKNNNSTAAHEGFLGFKVLGSSTYLPPDVEITDFTNIYGVVVVMNIYDPVSDTAASAQACNYNITTKTEDLPSTPATNVAPEPKADLATTKSNTAITIPNALLLANDVDLNNDPLTIIAVDNPSTQGGTVTFNATGVIYTPKTNWSGTDTFKYTIKDPAGETGAATVTVIVTNQTPDAVNDTADAVAGVAKTISVLSNDTDPEQANLTIRSVTQPSKGTAVISASTIIYTPAASATGTDTFSYTIADDKGATDTATVTVDISAANRAPTANKDTATTTVAKAVTINVIANDTDPEQNTLTVTNVSTPSKGTAVISNNQVVYTPRAGQIGEDTFTYTISDGKGNTAIGSVTVTINQAPVTIDDTATTTVNTPVTIDVLANDSDPNSTDVLRIIGGTLPANGTVRIVNNKLVYTPRTGFVGTDSFTYTVTDDKGNRKTAKVTITVGTAPNANKAPTAVRDTATTTAGNQVIINVLANDTDPENNTLTLLGGTYPRNGTVYKSGNSAVYIPRTGFVGTDTFTYYITDGKGNYDTGIVTVTVNSGSTNVAPVAVADTATTTSGPTLVKPVMIEVLKNDTDANGDTLSLVGGTNPVNGTVTKSGNNAIYTPRLGFVGTDTFTYTVSDGKGKTARGTVSVTVKANTAPKAVADNASVVRNTTTTSPKNKVTINVLNNDSDPDGDTLSLLGGTNPTKGTVIQSGNAAVYTPNNGATGTDTFTYRVSDGYGKTATATVTVTIN